MARWKSLWEQAAQGCRNRGGHVVTLTVAPPASESAVQEIEARLGQRIPASLREFFLHHSAEVAVYWQLDDEPDVPGLGGIACGEAKWSLAALPEVVASHQKWIDVAWNDPTDEYDRVWHGKFAFQAVPNGDMFAIDLASQAVVYLSCEDGEGHGFLLGADFIDFVDRWSALGLVGPEDWQWIPFTPTPDSFLLPDSEAGLSWRSWLGLP